MDKEKILPKHIGIIMDGNGRWAKKRLLPRTAGHVQGAKAFKKCARFCAKKGIECVTFYAFSTENWKRPKEEIDAIMKLFADYLDDALDIAGDEISIRFIGDPEPLSEALKEKLRYVTEQTAQNKRMILCIAINYGGRDDIVRAARKLAAHGTAPADITEESFSGELDTAGLPDVDLIIRPSGEQRLSNFMIWQAAYAEYVFMDVLWPDFGEKELDAALEEFSRRNRRFGGV